MSIKLHWHSRQPLQVCFGLTTSLWTLLPSSEPTDYFLTCQEESCLSAVWVDKAAVHTGRILLQVTHSITPAYVVTATFESKQTALVQLDNDLVLT